MYYHKALIGIETNTSTRPHRVLEMLRYTNVDVREQMDVLENRFVKRTGFETNTLTRPIIVAGLVELMRDFTYVEVDEPTLSEMITFVKNDKGKPEALQGKHDDLVIATAIAHFISSQQPAKWEIIKIDLKGFIESNFKLNRESKGADLW
jgi:phage terminase large subunit